MLQWISENVGTIFDLCGTDRHRSVDRPEPDPAEEAGEVLLRGRMRPLCHARPVP